MSRFNYIALLIAAYIACVSAVCDNNCSGHGSCLENDVCQCYDNWGVGKDGDISGDCSQRVCPFDIAWVDSASEDYDIHHTYAECSNRGVCNRESGDCVCFEGYEGKACQRASCPNDCSGHGTCEYIEDLKAIDNPTYDTLTVGNNSFVPYNSWDKHKSRACVCDGGYGDIDCSKRLCPFGKDAVYNSVVSPKLQTQKLTINLENPDVDGKQFALKFTSKLGETFTTETITLIENSDSDNEDSVRSALLKLPSGVIDSVVVTVDSSVSGAIDITFEFDGNSVQGPQNLIELVYKQCGDGCTPKITAPLDVISYENSYDKEATNISKNVIDIQADEKSSPCSGRGKCNYDTGICECFSGYTGDSCNHLTTLI